LLLSYGDVSAEGIECPAEIITGDGDVISWAATVELSSVHQEPVAIVEEVVGCARCVKVSCHLLGLIAEIGERDSMRRGE